MHFDHYMTAAKVLIYSLFPGSPAPTLSVPELSVGLVCKWSEAPLATIATAVVGLYFLYIAIEYSEAALLLPFRTIHKLVIDDPLLKHCGNACSIDLAAGTSL
eukprot:TRINITY_DN3946_c0_g1_i1.p1 TRINITY_DN3946_c0_g1~~TRINITY_DN3946_c0_g1_i1.p1  ORF type:complete len:103 (+),score=5.58 TRINITY_DN3946_c0_g1_i1:311-619(+)